MIRFLLTLLKFVLFFVTFAAGSFFPPFRLRQVLSVTATGTHMFVWDGVVLMVVLLAMILMIEAAAKRIRRAGAWTLVAFGLALVAGLAFKFGFLTLST
jgi:hypothetical protein